MERKIVSNIDRSRNMGLAAHKVVVDDGGCEKRGRVVSSWRRRDDATSRRTRLTDPMSNSENGLVLHLSNDLLDHLICEVIHARKKTEAKALVRLESLEGL